MSSFAKSGQKKREFRRQQRFHRFFFIVRYVLNKRNCHVTLICRLLMIVSKSCTSPSFSNCKEFIIYIILSQIGILSQPGIYNSAFKLTHIVFNFLLESIFILQKSLPNRLSQLLRERSGRLLKKLTARGLENARLLVR